MSTALALYALAPVRMYSKLFFLFIFYSADKENLLNNQKLL